MGKPKSCPFCGGKVAVEMNDSSYIGKRYMASCSNMNCLGHNPYPEGGWYFSFFTKSEAIDEWNKRNG